MDEQRLAEIEARANAATPGPWWYTEVPSMPRVRCEEKRGDYGTCAGYLVADCANSCLDDQAPHNAAFIGHARQDVPALIAEVRRLRAAMRDVLQLEAVSDDAAGLLADQVFAVACDRLHRALAADLPAPATTEERP